MALIAVRAVIDIAMHSLVILIGLPLRVTNRAGKHGIVRRIGVTVTARRRVPVLHRKPGVVEDSSLP